METFVRYAAEITPGVLLFAGVIFLIPPRLIGVPAAVAIMGFLYPRDSMTTAGLGTFGATEQGLPWLRFGADPAAYWLLAFTSAVLIVVLVFGLGRPARDLLVWCGRRPLLSPLWGLAGAALIIAPFTALYAAIPLDQRGGPVAGAAIPALLAMSLVGNALEEVLFRGYLFGALAGGPASRAVSQPPDGGGSRCGPRSPQGCCSPPGTYIWPCSSPMSAGR